MEKVEIVIVGGGIVGLSIALRLADDGHEVIVLDPDFNQDGASGGNAGVLATYGVLPVGTPAVLRNLPSLLLDRNSPLAIRHAALPSLTPWLLRFARESLPGAARRNAKSITALLADTVPQWKALSARIGCDDLLRQRGSLYLYETRAQFAAAASEVGWQRELGVQVDMIGTAELWQLEPGMRDANLSGAAYFSETVSTSDPAEILRRLRETARAAGVHHMTAKAERMERDNNGVKVVTDGTALLARRVIIAAGAWSRPLARMAGDKVPLDTERGYHLEFDMTQLPLSRPATPVARGFYFSPMVGRLRVAGTVELGGLDAPASEHRTARLLDGARSIFPDLPEPSRTWMGFRPSMPDSLPVIGPSRRGDDVIHAFGHGHLGLTLAPVTAHIVAALIAGKDPGLDIAAYSPTRF